MNRARMFRLIGLPIICLTLLVACKDDDESADGPFDRGAMLANYADYIIVPAYTSLSLKLDTLQDAADSFAAEPNEQTLSAIQHAWGEAYLRWQRANAFNFGPAGEQGLRKGLIEEIGTFPVSEVKIQTAINTGVYNLEDFNRDARGFFAVEYLIFDVDGDAQAILEKFAGGFESQLLTDLIDNMGNRVDLVISEWNGGYRDSFVGNRGTDVGSSTSLLYNEWVRSFEAVKNFKLGLPLGLRPGQTAPEPMLVEAYYSGYSLAGIHAHLTAIEDIWTGRIRRGAEGPGFEDYLATVTGGPALVEATRAQLENVNLAYESIFPLLPLSAQVVEEPMPSTALHTELQRLTRYFKSDMSSLLGLAITFSSGDGD